ncbi:hypothetical protein RSSM_05841 [Rhodopirellula sallentina SM41]|uniref:Uncharacterized protein n=1 Tax=Rhodopirellula sallentina SM41 TaxID=1263870 RepID=M5TUB9_9BACT|nr:hypothetical protein RSSM_05841 [Rhodopirellula sallentina SM41]
MEDQSRRRTFLFCLEVITEFLNAEYTRAANVPVMSCRSRTVDGGFTAQLRLHDERHRPDRY